MAFADIVLAKQRCLCVSTTQTPEYVVGSLSRLTLQEMRFSATIVCLLSKDQARRHAYVRMQLQATILVPMSVYLGSSMSTMECVRPVLRHRKPC